MLRVIALTLLAAFAAGAALAQPLATRGYASKADALVQAYVAADAFAGVVLVAVDGRPVFHKAYGLANRELGVPASLATRYRIASVSKPFTAVAVLKLVEQGKLSLDDRVARHYPAAPPSWADVTVRHLLTHGSGIANYTPMHDMVSTSGHQVDRAPEELVAVVRDRPLGFAPGSSYAYSNTNYVVLALIVERLSGQPFATFVAEQLFRPAGMTQARFDSDRDIIEGRSDPLCAGGRRLAKRPAQGGDHLVRDRPDRLHRP